MAGVSLGHDPIDGGFEPFQFDRLDQMFRESALAETTSTVEDLTGRKPRSLRDWLTENIGVFQN